MKFKTKAVHLGRSIEQDTGALSPDISLATTFLREPDGSYRSNYSYIRSNNPTRERLEVALAALEQQSHAITFASGLSAFSSLLLTLKPNDHILLSDDMYHGGKNLVSFLVNQQGLQAEYVNQQNLMEVEHSLRESTKMILIETPSNPNLKIVDIAKLAKLGKSVDAIVAVDNTWATPVLQNPILLGADAVLHSTTKYIGGHSDVQGGVIIPSDENEDLGKKIRSIQQNFGGVPSPFDCWLLLRSIPTLPLRVREQSENAHKLAIFLEQHDQVEQVLYPGLKNHFNHDIASKQMKGGYGGMISCILKQDEPYVRKVAGKTKVFKQATSLGGVESLIEHRASVEGYKYQTSNRLLRLSIGLEDVEDLQSDLTQALNHK